VKLVDFGADGAYDGGDDVSHEIEVAISTPSQWQSVDLPLANFSGLTTKESLAQIVISGVPTGSTVFVDNLLFRQ
jgi:hypothetical protein